MGRLEIHISRVKNQGLALADDKRLVLGGDVRVAGKLEGFSIGNPKNTTKLK